MFLIFKAIRSTRKKKIIQKTENESNGRTKIDVRKGDFEAKTTLAIRLAYNLR